MRIADLFERSHGFPAWILCAALWVVALGVAVATLNSLPDTAARLARLSSETAQLQTIQSGIDSDKALLRRLAAELTTTPDTAPNAVLAALGTIPETPHAVFWEVGRQTLPEGWLAIDHELHLRNELVDTATIERLVAAIDPLRPGLTITSMETLASSAQGSPGSVTVTFRTLVPPR